VQTLLTNSGSASKGRFVRFGYNKLTAHLVFQLSISK
jgi:hypothetical protein